MSGIMWARRATSPKGVIRRSRRRRSSGSTFFFHVSSGHEPRNGHRGGWHRNAELGCEAQTVIGFEDKTARGRRSVLTVMRSYGYRVAEETWA